MKITGYYHTDDAEYCERCGAPIANVVVINDDGTERLFGTTCAYRIMGNAAVEAAMLTASEKRLAERAIKREVMDKKIKLVPHAIELKSRQSAIGDEQDAVKALRMQYELSIWKRNHGI